MQQIVGFFISAFVVHFGQAQVQLKKGVNSTVAFEGAKLLIEVENPQYQDGLIELCLGSSADTTNKYCPAGYAVVIISVTANKKTTTLDRSGEMHPKEGLNKFGRVRFEDDGTLRVLVTDMPSGVTVTLLNAETPVKTTTTTAALSKVTSNKTVVIIASVTILFVLVVVVGITAWYFCFCRRKNDETVAVPNDQLCRMRRVEQIDIPKAGARKSTLPSSAITATRTSTSTTKAAKKPRVIVTPNLQPTPTTVSKPDLLLVEKSEASSSVKEVIQITDSKILSTQ